MKSSRLSFFGILSAVIACSLVGSSANAQQRFGQSLIVSDSEIIVAEPENTYRPGAVYVYRKDSGSWEQVSEITAPDAQMNDRFGRSIAADGDVLVVGSTGSDDRGGKVYIYERDGDGWVHRQTLVPDDVTRGARFGGQVAVSGDFLFASAPSTDDAPGSVYVYHRGDDGTWAMHSTLRGSSAENGAGFGARLVAQDQTLFVAAPNHDNRMGAVYRFSFDPTADAWTEAQVLSGRGLDDESRMGLALELMEGSLLVGAPGFGQRLGAVFVFEPEEETGDWGQTATLLPYAATRAASFGSSISADGNTVWVGAPFGDGFQGSVYAFTRDESGWKSASRVSMEELGRGDLFGQSVGLRGSVAAVGIVGADFGSGAVAIFEQDASGAWISSHRLVSAPESLEPVTGGQVNCEDGTAAMFPCEGVDLLSFLPISELGGGRGVDLNDIWGWTDPQTGREYALVGRVDGTAFVDVTDPYHPVYVGELPKTKESPGSVWRDIKVYRDHAFIVADGAGPHGMQVFDLTRLRGLSGEPVTFEPDAHYSGINSAHNIVINTDTGFAYTVGNSSGGETCGGGLHMINIQDPLNPTFAGCYSASGTGRAGTGYTHDAQCLVYNGPDSEYAGREICFGSNETALNIADVTDKENPVSIASASYPNVSYTHQGWISEDHRYFYVNDELDELTGNADQTRTLIWDVTDLDDPQLVKEYMWGPESSDHNLYVKGNRLYMSNYKTGLRVHDITDPVNPVEIGYFDTMPVGDDGPGFSGSWSNYPFFESGTVAVSSIGEGLFLLRPRDNPGL